MDETVLISRSNKACCCCAEPRGHKGWLNYITGTNDPIRHLFCIVGTYFILARGNNQTHQCTTDKLFFLFSNLYYKLTLTPTRNTRNTSSMISIKVTFDYLYCVCIYKSKSLKMDDNKSFLALYKDLSTP